MAKRKKKGNAKRSNPSRGNRYGADVKKSVKKAVEEGGQRAMDIAKAHGISVYTVKAWKKEWGLARSYKKRRAKSSKHPHGKRIPHGAGAGASNGHGGPTPNEQKTYSFLFGEKLSGKEERLGQLLDQFTNHRDIALEAYRAILREFES